MCGSRGIAPNAQPEHVRSMHGLQASPVGPLRETVHISQRTTRAPRRLGGTRPNAQPERKGALGGAAALDGSAHPTQDPSTLPKPGCGTPAPQRTTRAFTSLSCTRPNAEPEHLRAQSARLFFDMSGSDFRPPPKSELTRPKSVAVHKHSRRVLGFLRDRLRRAAAWVVGSIHAHEQPPQAHARGV